MSKVREKPPNQASLDNSRFILFFIKPLVDVNTSEGVSSQENYETLLKNARKKLREDVSQDTFGLSGEDGIYSARIYAPSGQDDDQEERISSDEEDDQEESPNATEADLEQSIRIRELLQNLNKKNESSVEHKDIDEFIELMAKNLNFTFTKEKSFFQNEYFVKYEYRFFYDEFSTNFQEFLRWFYLLDNSSLIVEVTQPAQAMLLQECLKERNAITKFDNSVLRFGFGTLVNLNKFFERFFLTQEEICLPSERNSDRRMTMEVDLNFKILFIYIQIGTHVIKLIYTLHVIKSIILEKHENFDRIFFEVKAAPKIYSKTFTEDFDEDFDDSFNKGWMRMGTAVFPDLNSDPKNLKVLKKLRFEDYGMSNAFYLDIPAENNLSLLEMIFSTIFYAQKHIQNFISFYLCPIQICPTSSTSQDIADLIDSQKFPFFLHYACLVLFSSNFKAFDIIKDENFLQDFFTMIQDVLVKNLSRIEESLIQVENFIYFLLQQVRDQLILKFKAEFLKNFAILDQLPEEKLHEDYYFVRKILIFPSHIEYLRPKPLLNSRFNNFASVDNTLRIRLEDDSGASFGEGLFQDQEYAIARVKRIMLKGLRIGGKHFEFLGSSSSQMRNYSATFYSTDETGRNAVDLRKMFGKFKDNEQSVSKYIARFGLLFSQTICIFPLDKQIKINDIPDIQGGFKPLSSCKSQRKIYDSYILSDGIGYMSQEVSDYFYSMLPEYHQKNYIPSAYQVRYAGYKGVLTLNPAVTGKQIFFRDSMKKFTSSCTRMGLLKYAYPRSVTLNRPLLMILDDALKIEHHKLYRFIYDCTHVVSNATCSEESAFKFMNEYSKCLFSFKQIHFAGISLLEEPFLRNMLTYLLLHRLNFEYKFKVRVPVSPQYARIAFGVLDETGTLKPGEIFFQATKLLDDGTVFPNERCIFRSPVMVTKFPCLQPGDVRKFKAVDVPALHHIKDCIVFPAQGQRSHCDEMGGSDLDGDEYAIYWDTDIIFYGPNKRPMDFPYGQSMAKGDINDQTMNQRLVDFYCDYFKQQNIGKMAFQHMKIADFHPDGLYSRECEILAFNYNIMLDFAKSGYCQTDQIHLRMNYQPDFMVHIQRSKHYLSPKILGQFNRHFALVEHSVQIARETSNSCKTFRNRSDGDDGNKNLIKNRLTLPDWELFREPATEAFQRYKTRILAILEQSDVTDEAVLFSGVYEEKEDANELLLKELMIEFQTLFKKQCRKLKIGDEIGRVLLASAWYTICFEKSFLLNGKPLLGLPWLILEEICQLAMYTYSGKIRDGTNVEFRVIIKKGRVVFKTIGVLHNQIVLYNAKNVLWNGLSFNYSIMNIQLEKSIRFQYFHWKWPMIDEELNRFKDAECLKKNFASLVRVMTQRVVLNLVRKLFTRIREDVYRDDKQQRFIKYCEIGKIEESEFLDKILENLVADSFSKWLKSCCPTISSVFDYILIYLNNIINNPNYYVLSPCKCSGMEQFEDLKRNSVLFREKIAFFLIKYAVFAASFLNSIDHYCDRTFYTFLNIEFMQERVEKIKILREYSTTEDAEKREQLSKVFVDQLMRNEQVYQTQLDKIFNCCVAETKNFDKVQQTFMLLPMKFQLLNFEQEITEVVKFLSGIDYVEFKRINYSNYTAALGRRAATDADQLEEWKNFMIQVRTNGFDHSLIILRLFLGNPAFYTSIWPILRVYRE